jgi:hypothetical protein
MAIQLPFVEASEEVSVSLVSSVTTIRRSPAMVLKFKEA